MTSSTLYNLHSDGDDWRITKFTDGNPEGSYLTSETECQCPAGVRPTCRHRQMLPRMLRAGLANTHWFWDHDRHAAYDIMGNSKSLTDALERAKPPQMAIDVAPAEGNEQDVLAAPAKPWRRI